MAIDLFTPLVSADRFHPNFVRLMSDTDWDVREVLEDWSRGFEDRDGKFVQEFQLTFNSGWWELYIFAVLKSLGVAVDFSHDAPDFVMSDGAFTIEAVISSHAVNSTPEWLKTVGDISKYQDIEPRWLETLARLYNSIDGKRKLFERRYSSMAHVRNRPFVIAVHNFSTPDSFQLGDVAMQRLLYDFEGRENFLKNGNVELPLGIFSQEAFRNVSAVLYSSVATYGKVRAIGRSTANLLFQAIRIKDNHEIIRVNASKTRYRESLRDGLRVFHNPNAAYPLPPELFDYPDVREFRIVDGEVFTSCHPDGDLCMRQVIRAEERK